MKEICELKIRNKLNQIGIVAVVTFENIEEVRPTIKALHSGGVRALELALRTPIAFDAIKIVHDEFPDILLGAGTVIKTDQIKKLKNIGIDFAVSPGINRNVLNSALEYDIPFAPGITTASDIETALEFDCKLLKFFPAEKIGGLSYLEAINGPYKYLGIKYLPLGGLSQTNIKQYFNSEIISCIGGSWIANRTLIKNNDFHTIKTNAKNAMTIFNKERNNE